MQEYEKIPTVFKRDPETKFRTLIDGQYATPEISYLSCNQWTFTEKVDGTNIRVMWLNGEIVFGGKTDNARIPAHLINRLNQMILPLKDVFSTMFDGDACLYGEGYGAKIQKGGGNYSDTQEFVLFDVKVGRWWLERPSVEDIAEKLALRCVPMLGDGPLPKMIDIVRAGLKSTWGDFPAEGIVARPAIALTDRAGRLIITKLKTKDFCQA